MKAKNTTIRAKLVWALLAGAGMAGACMLILCVIMLIASLSRPFAVFFNQHVFSFILLFLFIFSWLTIAFFLILVRKNVLYLEEITRTLDQISDGSLDIHISVKTHDELGKMAETVNSMAARLKASIEEERRLEKSKNDLIANMSHDLRTPLTSVLGYLQLISHMDCSDAEKVRQYSAIAYNQCKDLKVLIDDLFEFSKLNNSGIAISKAWISLGQLLEQVILGFMPSLTEAGMEYRLYFPGGKVMVNADPLLLTRVFDNLISNAIKYGKDGKYLDVELKGDGTEAVIRIINFGEPIPEADLPHVFERFYRVDKSRSGHDGGAGLGLAIVKSIIELHKGSVGVSSSEGRTVFIVRLPAGN